MDCGILAQGDGLVTLTTSQAPVTSSPRKKLRASRTIATQQATVRTCHETRPVKHQQVRRVQRAAFFVSSSVTGTERGQCKSSNEQLMMWGRYPHIDTSPHRTTWRYIPEDSTLHNHSYGNLKSYNTYSP
jgi:hypothetical protein